MKERRDAAREKVEQESPPEPSAEGGKEEKTKPEPEQPKPRRGRPPKEKAVSEDKDTKAATPRRGRPPRLTRRPLTRPRRPNLETKCPESGSEKATADKGGSISAAAPAQEQAPAAPTPPPRPVEEGKVIYLKLSELHPFHTFRDHPFKVEDNAAMTDLVSTIKGAWRYDPRHRSARKRTAAAMRSWRATAAIAAVSWPVWTSCPVSCGT